MSSDRSWLAIAGDRENGLYLWDLNLATADPIHLPIQASKVDFTADNQRLITTDRQSIRLWDLRLDELMTIACQTAGRNFTQLEWRQYFPDQPYRKTCEQWPLENSGQ